MPTFSKKSLERLSSCDRRLYDICSDAIKIMDFVVLCGHRTQEEQDKAFADGKSKLQWPRSKHNTSPSMAVDLAPYPVDFSDIERFKKLAIVIKRIASSQQVGIKWGGDWKTFKDYVHFQLTTKE